MELLEREVEREALEGAIAESREAGRVVAVIGEAGIGKTALVTAVTEALDGGRRVLWGACDPLITPRPMGPLHDVARLLGGPMLAALEGAGSREGVLSAALDELAGSAVLVIEDLHWADDATLDIVALLGRRLVRSPGCLILTSRSDALPEVRRVLGSLPRSCVRRVEPPALSPDAVALLAERAGHDPFQLHAVSGGNPFFVTEALAAPAGGGVPVSVRDAVALRVAALSPAARAVLEFAAVVPGSVELSLLNADASAIDECIVAGLLSLRDESLSFRHDLARRAVEEGISPVRQRELDGVVLRALEATGNAEPARLAHHARRAGDTGAILSHAPVAARSASAGRGHRQALEHWEAVLVAAGGDDPEALEGIALEAYLCGRPERAVEARRALLAIHEAAGDGLRAGDDLRWLSRGLWWLGKGTEAAAAGEQAIAILEAFPESRELALALSGQSQLAMLSERGEEAIALGTRAVALGRRLDDSETVAHGLTNVGTALIGGPETERGRALLEEAFVLATGAGHDDHAARALVNLSTGTLFRLRGDARADGDVERALRFAQERELEGYVQYMLGVRSNLRLLRGEWRTAEADARASLGMGEQFGVSQCPALIVIGKLQARRGSPEAGTTLDEAWEHAVATHELQRLAPAAAARAEHAWLEGDLARTVAFARPAYELAVTRGDAWACAELAFWLWRGGEPVAVGADGRAPYARSVAGDWRGAAAAWASMGFPYERAEALSEADEEDARLEALALIDEFGAARAASNLRRRLRAAGVRRIPRGPRPASRSGPAGLTPRETEVVDLIVRGATNSEIAQTLVIAPKTVDHHVSAVLGKLGVASRREAGAALERLGAGADGD